MLDRSGFPGGRVFSLSKTKSIIKGALAKFGSKQASAIGSLKRPIFTGIKYVIIGNSQWTKHGILIEQFSWLSPDAITGKFSSEIRAGYYIKDGEITEPIKGGLVIGNIFDMIKNIQTISNDSVITSGANILAGICPYIAFEDVQIAGK